MHLLKNRVEYGSLYKGYLDMIKPRIKLIIAGSRSITDRALVYSIINEFYQEHDIDEVICGMADGVDILGKQWAEDSGHAYKEMPVLPSEKWCGGPCQRNQRMADYARESGNGGLLLIWDGESPGSADMLKRAKKAKIYIMVVDLSQPRLI